MTSDALAMIAASVDKFVRLPNGIGQLRNALMAAAFTGKLVPQNSNAGSADLLLEELALERESLNGRRDRSLATVPTKPSELPETWRCARLGDCAASIEYGFTAKAESSGEGPHMLRITDLKADGIDWSTVPFCTTISAEGEAKYRLAFGDILFARTGGTVGKSHVYRDDRKTIFASYLIRLRPLQAINIDYLSLWLKSPDYWRQLYAGVTGTGQPNFNGSKLANLVVPLPPRAEQDAIAAILSELLDHVNSVETALAVEERHRKSLCKAAFRELGRHQNPLALDHLKELIRIPSDLPDLEEAILGLALTGHLVEPAPACETADGLLAQIAAKKEDLGLRGEIDTREPNDSLALPDGWRLVALGDILAHCRNGTSAKPNDLGIGYPLLRISAATSRRDGVVDLSDYKFAEMPEDQAAPYLVRPGDLLACRFNGNLHYVGRVSQVPAEVSRPVIHPDKLICMRAIIVSHAYLRYVLNSPYVRRQIEGVATTTAGNIGINGKQLKALAVPLAPLSEQDRIASRLDEVFALLGQLAEFLE